MSKLHLQCVVVCLLCLVTTSVSAQPLLLAELHYGDGQAIPHMGPPLNSFRFGFTLGGSPGLGGWSREVAATDLGQTFHPDAQNLAGMALAWASPTLAGTFGIHVSDTMADPNLHDELLTGVFPNAAFTHITGSKHVADPFAYELADVAVTIDSWVSDVVPVGGGIIVSGGMSVRFYAEAIPEPSCLGLGSLALSWLVTHRKQKGTFYLLQRSRTSPF